MGLLKQINDMIEDYTVRTGEHACPNNAKNTITIEKEKAYKEMIKDLEKLKKYV